MKKSSFLVKDPYFKEKTKAHILPIVASSSYVFDDITHGIEIFKGNKEGHVYSRYGNPTIEAVADKIAQLESYGLDMEAFGIMTSSGMSAISTVLFAELKAGDTIITQANLYGGTTELLNSYIKKLGINIIWADLSNIDELEHTINNNSITLLYCESPANPSMACVDLKKIQKIAKRHNITTVVDNTFCTPYLQQPLKYDIDYVIHSTTKFLNGHGNSIAGIIIGKDRSSQYGKIWDAMKMIGTNCNPFDAWLVSNGLKTLALRMEAHSSNALAIATHLESLDSITKVNYPFLASHESFSIASGQMLAGGGMLSFELEGGVEKGIAFMNKIKFCTLAPTLGDVDTLILHPASMSHRNVDRSIRYANGITDGLIRMSVGIEDVQDIIHDINQALV